MEHNVLCVPCFFDADPDVWRHVANQRLKKVITEPRLNQPKELLTTLKQDDVAEFLRRTVVSVERSADDALHALVPWFCDALRSPNSLKAYAADLAQFTERMLEHGVAPLNVTADHVRVYKAALEAADLSSATIARKLTTLHGVYQRWAETGHVDWKVAQAIQRVQPPPVEKNRTPGLTPDQAVAILQAVSTDTLIGIRDLAMLQILFETIPRVSALCAARIGDVVFDGRNYHLHLVEKGKKHAAPKLLRHSLPYLKHYIAIAGISDDRRGPLLRPLNSDRTGFGRRHIDRKTPWRRVKFYCRQAGIDPERLLGPGIGVHSLRKTGINDAFRNGATIWEVKKLAGHRDIRTTQGYFDEQDVDADSAVKKMSIRRLLDGDFEYRQYR